MKIRHIAVIALFVLINVLVFWALFGRGGEKEEQKEEEVYVPHLEALQVKNESEQFKTGGYGTISSFNTIDIACEVQGKLISGKHKIKPGVKFKKGDLLFRINDAESRYSIGARKSNFINLIANILPDVKVDFGSEYQKWKDYIDQIKLNKPLPQLPAWKSEKEKIFLSNRNIIGEYFSIKSLEEQLSKFQVYAPFSGVITEVYMNDFAVVNPGAKIMQIVETGDYEVPVSIPLSQLSLIEIGTEGKIYSTDGTEKGIGKVVRISEVINRNTQSVDVYLKAIPAEGEQFIQGEYVRVEINQTGDYSGIRIPANGVMDDQVYLYSKKDSSLKKQTVQVLNENEKGVFVSGLKDDQYVIIQEVMNYSDTLKYGIILR
ncbi:MAG: HlyD family efflux transporter periplasmic adaptor subunit [Flavobacteriales bacterium]|nr:HlyD family efflux transporter periplasmic adaptor subunit [Flavobacteriales bacterium]